VSAAAGLPAGVRVAAGLALDERKVVRLDLAAPEFGGRRTSLVMTPAEARALAVVLWDEAGGGGISG
jgi:hypothetical protein